MPLIDYDSESDSEGAETEKINVVTKRSRMGLDLPMPKKKKTLVQLESESPEPNGATSAQSDPNNNTLPKNPTILSSNNPKPESDRVRVLGGGVKVKYFDGDIAIPEMEAGATKSEHKINRVEVIPASIAARIAKYGSAERKITKKGPMDPALIIARKRKQDGVAPRQTFDNLFSTESKDEAPISKPSFSSNATSYRPMMVEAMSVETGVRTDNQDHPTSESSIPTDSLSHFIPKNANIVDFNLDDFYDENEKLRQAGLLEESKRPVASVAGGKHQITTLLRSAQQNQQGLEEMHAEGRKNKREARAKHGF